MKNRKWIKSVAAMSLFAVISCSGCAHGDGSSIVSRITVKQVLKVDGRSYSLPKAKVYLVNYQNLYGKMYGVDLWKQDAKDDSLETYVKNLTVAQLTKILSMDSLAESREIKLEETELAAVQKAASAYYKSLTEQELEYLDVAEEDLRALYEDYALAQKLYRMLISEIDSEVSDDEARVMDAMQIVVSGRDTAKQVRKELKNGGDFTSLANSYNEAGRVKIQFSRGTLPEEVEAAAFALDNDECTDWIKTDEGYYFIYCVNKFNEELTDAHKLEIVQQREKEAFGDVYDAYSGTLEKKLYKKTWDEVSAEPTDGIGTDSFFSVYQEYCGELFGN